MSNFNPSRGSRLNWSDVNALYNDLRGVQRTHHVTETAAPNKTNQKAEARDAKKLVNAIEALGTSAAQITTAEANVAGTIPKIGDLITPSIFKECSKTLTRLQGVAYNSNNYQFDTNSVNYLFSSHSTNDGFHSNRNNYSFSSNGTNHGFRSNTSNIQFSFSGYDGFGTNRGHAGHGEFCTSM